MNYLDERIIANIDLESQSGSYITTTGMYRFFIYDDTDPSKNLFVGNTFLQENTMKAYIDITDFARNYCANKTSVVRLDVAVRVNDSTERTDEIEILPIYRYPNAKADDNQYNFGSYDTFLYSGKQTFDRSFYKSNSLFPTYP